MRHGNGLSSAPGRLTSQARAAGPGFKRTKRQTKGGGWEGKERLKI